MKNILLMITCLAYSFYGTAQQLRLNDSISVIVPATAEKLTNDQLVFFSQQRGYDVKVIKLNPKNVYRLADILLALYDIHQDFKPDFTGKLKVLDVRKGKSEADALHKRYYHNNINYTSTIHSINGHQALIMKDTHKDIITYRFSIVNDSNTLAVNGLIDCVKSDENKAEKLLNEVLRGVKFAN